MRNTGKNIILLGAGASKSEGAPLQKELFNEFFNLYRRRSNSLKNTLNQYVEKIERFFSDFWGIDIYDEPITNIYPTFEECLGVLEIALYRGDCFRSYSKEELKETKNALIYLIAKILQEKLENAGKYPNKLYHKKLVDNLENEEELKNTVFVSLNYDLIIDNVLYLKPNYQPKYGIKFVNNRLTRQEDHTRNHSIYLLKIHGSLNWLYCPICNQVKITILNKGVLSIFEPKNIFGDEAKCPICHSPTEPIIIPPSYYKDMSNIYVQQVFLKADEFIRKAKNIFICGYSFPDADLHIKYLFKRAELYNRKTPNIFIISHSKYTSCLSDSQDDKNKEKKQRYCRFFKNKEHVYFTNLSFEQFAESGIKKIVEEYGCNH